MTRACIGLGTNLGDRERMIDDAIEAMATINALSIIATSSLWETEPVGPPQPRYLNAVCLVECALPPRALLDALQAIEARMGRVRSPQTRNGPRTIDLDILLLGDECIQEPGMVIPHPRLCERAFVLAPLLEIAPDWVHPASREPLASAFSALQGTDAGRGVAVWRARTASLRG
jgi:2-amino-4-hydroxy-6-hydroxymethyldihydropteridine diphosphokinase